MASKARMRLTDAGIARLRPRESKYTVLDTRTPGLGVRVRPSGGTSFLLFRKTDGRSTRLSLGSVASRNVDDVRRQCHALMATPDPEHRTKRTCKVPLFRDFVARPWKESHFPRYKPSTRNGVNTVLTSQLVPAFGSTPLDRITPNDVLHWFDAYSQTAPRGCQSRAAHPTQDSRIRHRPRSYQHQSRQRRDHEPAHRAHPRSVARRTPAFAPGTRPTRPNRHATHTPSRHHPVAAANRMSQGRNFRPALERGGRRRHRHWRYHNRPEESVSQCPGASHHRAAAQWAERVRVSVSAQSRAPV